jgi:outer membrane protein assembly factor BamB
MKRIILLLVLIVIPFATVTATANLEAWPQRGFDSQKRGAVAYQLGFMFENGIPLVVKGPVEGIATYGNDIIANLGNKIVICASKDGLSKWGITLEARAYGAPSIFGNNAFLACENGYIKKLDIANGKILWNTKIADSLTTEITIYGRYGFIGIRKGIICIDLANGSFIWRSDTPNQIQTPSASSGFVMANYEDGLVCFLATTGGKVWDKKSSSELIGCPVIDEDKVYISTTDGFLKCLSLWNGAEIWKAKRDYTAAIPTIDDDKIYFPGKGKVTCLIKTVGKKVWETKVGDEVIWAQIIKSGNNLIVGGTDQNVYILTSEKGELKTKLPISGSVSMQMALGNGYLVLPDIKLRLFIYNSLGN